MHTVLIHVGIVYIRVRACFAQHAVFERLMENKLMRALKV